MKVILSKYILTVFFISIHILAITNQQENVKKSTTVDKQLKKWNKKLEQLTEEDSIIKQEINKYYSLHSVQKQQTNPLTNSKKPITLTESWNQTIDFFKRNALYLCTAIGVYWTFCFIKHKIVQATNYLSQPTLWSSWRNDLSLNSLLSIPKETLTQWVLEDIQQQYLDNPIKSFYKDIQVEYVQLREIVNLYDNLNFFYMVDEKALTDVENRIKVLNLLKDLVLMWELEHAIAQA